MIEYTSPKTTHLWSNEQAPYVFILMSQLYMPPASAHIQNDVVSQACPQDQTYARNLTLRPEGPSGQ